MMVDDQFGPTNSISVVRTKTEPNLEKREERLKQKSIVL